MKTLKLAQDLSLPVDVVTQTIAVLAKRRAGKSYTMRRLVEQLFKAGQQVVLVDPKGDQWGLRSSADGKSPGLPFIILGGERGDVKLESGAGEVVARLVVEERVSVLLDLSLFRKHEVATFMTAFLETLYRLKAKEIYRTPVMLVLDEADAIAPQKPQKGEERMLGAAEDIVRRGGQRGIGCVFVTQRSAVLNKNVLTQAQILIALRTIAPQDLGAMKAWIDVHGTLEQQKTLMESLPALPIGDAWVWAPGWPTVDGIFKRVHILPIETFDSGKSPDPGAKKPVEPKSVADVDIEALKRQMSATIEKSKADDPRELKKQLAEAQHMLARQAKSIGDLQAASRQQSDKNAIVIPAKPALTDADRALLEKLATAIAARTTNIEGWLGSCEVTLTTTVQKAVANYLTESRSVIQKFAGELDLEKASVKKLLEKLNGLAVAPAANVKTGSNYSGIIPKPHQPQRIQQVKPATSSGSNAPRTLQPGDPAAIIGNSGLRRILIALAERNGLSRGQLGMRASVSSKGGSFDSYVSKGRVNGWIVGASGRFEITDAGRDALGHYEPLPTGRALLDHYLRELGQSGAARMLKALADIYPNTLGRQELGEAATVASTGGSFDSYVSRLRTLELIEGERNALRASREFFEA